MSKTITTRSRDGKCMFFEQLHIQNWGFLLQKDIKTNGKTNNSDSSLQISAVPQRIDTCACWGSASHWNCPLRAEQSSFSWKYQSKILVWYGQNMLKIGYFQGKKRKRRTTRITICTEPQRGFPQALVWSQIDPSRNCHQGVVTYPLGILSISIHWASPIGVFLGWVLESSTTWSTMLSTPNL